MDAATTVRTAVPAEKGITQEPFIYFLQQLIEKL